MLCHQKTVSLLFLAFMDLTKKTIYMYFRLFF